MIKLRDRHTNVTLNDLNVLEWLTGVLMDNSKDWMNKVLVWFAILMVASIMINLN